jgi:formylglycine-generating enzyme required for sulfatase activity
MKKNIILTLAVFLAAMSTPIYAQDLPGIVLDKRLHLYWQDNRVSQKNSDDWYEANDYCEKLALNGMDKWRLPTFKELFSIVDYTRTNPAVNSAFSFTHEDTYWTSTNFAATPSRAWTIDFRTGATYYSYKSTNHGIRCVRDIPQKEKKEIK